MSNDQVLTLSTEIALPTELQKRLLRDVQVREIVASMDPIDDADTANAVGGEITNIKQRIAALEAARGALLAPTNKIKAAVQEMIARINALFAPPLQSLQDAEQIHKARLVDWREREQKRVDDENRALREEQRQRDQEAQEMVAAERARAMEEARIAEEAAAKAEAIRQEAIAAGDDQRAVAAAAEVASKLETAAAVMSNAESRVMGLQMAAGAATQQLQTVAKIDGVAMVDKWVAELAPGFETMDDARDAIIVAAASDRRLRGLLTINEMALRKQAESLKSAMVVPGFTARNRPYARGSKR